MPRTTARQHNTEPAPVGISAADVVAALRDAILSIKGQERKTVATRVKRNPWMPTDGSPKITSLKRRCFHHGIEIDPRYTHNDVCLLLDRIRPGKYCNGWVTVHKRQDGGINIDYPIRTAAQRLKLVNTYGIRSFKELLERIIDERSDPRKYTPTDDEGA